MATQLQERNRKKVQETKTEPETEVTESVSATKQQTAGNSAVPSPSSSPSHEFSFFTVSLQNSERTTTTTTAAAAPTTAAIERSKPPFAIDLSPADDIFFNGHLLPLHFLSHLQNHASSPRSSTNSLDSFTLPITGQEKPITNSHTCSCTGEDDDCFSYHSKDFDKIHEPNTAGNCNTKQSGIKSKPFSLFGLGKWRKPADAKDTENQNQNQNQNQQKKKLKFDVSQFLKRYIKMMKPLLSSREKNRVHRQSYSFSATTLSPRDKRQIRGRRGEFSAPASMRTSPTNSGRLVVTAGLPPPASDSTMEELQAAIQAAIAHCKNSIAAEGKRPQELPVPVK